MRDAVSGQNGAHAIGELPRQTGQHQFAIEQPFGFFVFAFGDFDAETGVRLTPNFSRNAFARNRVVENEGLVLWVCERIRFRLESYRYALSNLVIEVPGREAVQSERAIMALEAEAGPMCAMPLIGLFGSAAPEPLPPPPTAPPPPVVYKG